MCSERVSHFLLRQQALLSAHNPGDLLTVIGGKTVKVDRFGKRRDMKDDIVFNNRRGMSLRRRVADDLEQLADPQPRVGQQWLVIVEFLAEREQCCKWPADVDRISHCDSAEIVK